MRGTMIWGSTILYEYFTTRLQNLFKIKLKLAISSSSYRVDFDGYICENQYLVTYKAYALINW